jgi:hypothetical protein
MLKGWVVGVAGALGLAMTAATIGCDGPPRRRHGLDEDDEREERERPGRRDPVLDVSAAPTAAAKDALPPRYVRYQSILGGFEIMMPCAAPKEEGAPVGSSAPYRVTCSLDHGEVAVSVRDEVADIQPSQLDDSVRVTGTLLIEDGSRSKVTVLQTFEGRDVEGAERGGARRAHLRVFGVKQRLYQLTDVGLSDAESLVWRNSFRLAGGPPPIAANALPKACEDYFAAMRTCMDKTMATVPEPSREQMKKQLGESERQMRESWSKMSSPAMDQACKMAQTAIEQACKSP